MNQKRGGTKWRIRAVILLIGAMMIGQWVWVTVENRKRDTAYDTAWENSQAEMADSIQQYLLEEYPAAESCTVDYRAGLHEEYGSSGNYYSYQANMDISVQMSVDFYGELVDQLLKLQEMSDNAINQARQLWAEVKYPNMEQEMGYFGKKTFSWERYRGAYLYGGSHHGDLSGTLTVTVPGHVYQRQLDHYDCMAQKDGTSYNVSVLEQEKMDSEAAKVKLSPSPSPSPSPRRGYTPYHGYDYPDDEEDEYDVGDYTDPEDFYYDHEDDFYDYEDAEEYFYEYGG